MTYPEVLFEDNHVLVAIKPAGVLSQADGSDAPDMLTLLKQYLKEKYNKPGQVYLGLLHRLDRNVSGVMVFAKTSKCASRISEQIRQHKLVKKYRAVAYGFFEKKQAELSNYLVKDEKSNTVRIFDSSVPNSKLSKLSYTVLGEADFEGKNVSLVEVKLETGRSHQIRAQLAHEGHSLVGDTKYGIDAKTSSFKLCLQSYKLGFFHPINGEFLEYTIGKQSFEPWCLFDDSCYQ